MGRKIVFWSWLVGASCGLSSFLLPLFASAAAEGLRLGVLDIQRVILNVDEGKNARAELEKEIKAKEASLGKQKQELDKLNEEWKAQGALLSAEAKMRKQGEFQEKFMELRNIEMKIKSELGEKEKEATQKIASKAAKIAEGLAKEKKLPAVFESSSSGLVYIESPVDLTDEVIAAYNKAPKDPKEVSKR